MTTTAQIRFSSAIERKTYSAGLAIIAAKLRGHRQPTAAEREAATVAKGKAILAKRFSTKVFVKMFGTPPPAPPKPAPAAAGPRTLHRYVCRRWLATVPA